MTQGRTPDGRRAALPPFPRRSRKRWTVAASVAAVWFFLYLMSRSALSATLLLLAFAATGAIAVLFLRYMGITREHPWMLRLASRPWRDGQDVLRVAVSHLHDIFVITPSGSVFAPSSVEIHMNPQDLLSLCDRMELSVVTASVTEVYEEQVLRYGARFVTPELAEVSVVADDRIPQGRYSVRQGRPDTAAARRETEDASRHMSPELAHAVPPWADAAAAEGTRHEPGPALTIVDAPTAVAAGTATVLEKALAPVPILRLVTGDSVARTRLPVARAGRGPVELVLPNVPTISREHARFAFAEGRWFVTNLGVNGLTVNGTPAAGKHPLSDGDTIRWGSRPDALVSRVEIG